MYEGRIASRSTKSKKLVAYARGFLTTASRSTYSIVKSPVKSHSTTRSSVP